MMSPVIILLMVMSCGSGHTQCSQALPDRRWWRGRWWRGHQRCFSCQAPSNGGQGGQSPGKGESQAKTQSEFPSLGLLDMLVMDMCMHKRLKYTSRGVTNWDRMLGCFSLYINSWKMIELNLSELRWSTWCEWLKEGCRWTIKSDILMPQVACWHSQ